jgi:hypothetical protein
MRYIDADILIKNGWRLERHAPSGMVISEMSIADVPTADVAEVRHGKWTLHTDGSGTCSECGTTQKNVWDYDSSQNYCGHCGARMDGDEDD